MVSLGQHSTGRPELVSKMSITQWLHYNLYVKSAGDLLPSWEHVYLGSTKIFRGNLHLERNSIYFKEKSVSTNKVEILSFYLQIPAIDDEAMIQGGSRAIITNKQWVRIPVTLRHININTPTYGNSTLLTHKIISKLIGTIYLLLIVQLSVFDENVNNGRFISK